MTDTTARAKAGELGRQAGLAAASWVFDGNTTDETYRRFLQGWDDGDPAVMDGFSHGAGWLSGEHADDMTQNSLADLLGLGGADTDEEWAAVDEVCTAYEDSAELAYWAELERVAHLHTKDGD